MCLVTKALTWCVSWHTAADAEDDTEDTDVVYVDSDEGPEPPALLPCSDSDDKEDNNNNNNNEDFFNISPEETVDILPSKSLPDASVKVNVWLRQATISASKPLFCCGFSW
ncbi:hypothetical protein HGRIS_011206 [Hohenbuehelia grisea]|uniref:Uncharacterized protein n=1 Tax=Hohenbuehelia grisea TaxID=104357 RepID=A0ABR3JVA8_9AGAR